MNLGPAGVETGAADVSSGTGLRVVRIAPCEMLNAALFYLALTVVLAWPLSARPASTVLWAGPDTELFIWTLAWDAHAFVSQPASIFDANIYAPERRTLAYSENLIGSALIAAPVIWITGNPVLAMNVVALLSCALCGFGAWLLARRAGVRQAGAVLAGIVFAFSPPRFFRIGQLHLGPVQWVPFGLVFLQAHLDEGKRRDLRIAIGLFTLQALTSGHGAVFMAIAMVGLVAYRAILAPPAVVSGFSRTLVGDVSRSPAAGARRAWAFTSTALRDAGIPGLLLLLPAVLSFIPYRLVQTEMGLRRPLENWSIPPVSFLASPSHVQRAILGWLSEDRINVQAGAYLFPGYLPLLLALVVLVAMSVRALRRLHGRADAWTRVARLVELTWFFSIAVGIFVTAIGPIRLWAGGVRLFAARDPLRAWLICVALAGIRLALARRVPFDMPARASAFLSAGWRLATAQRQNMIVFYALLTILSLLLSIGPPLGLWPLVYWLPGFNFIRVPSRFTILAMLGLAVLAGAGFERLRARVSRRRGVALAFLVGALLVSELAVAPLDVIPYRLEIPAIDRWLDTQSKPFTVAEVPSPDPRNAGALERRQTMFMLHSTAHWQKTVHGYSGIRPPQHAALYADLFNFPDEASLRRLSDMHVTYVVVHQDLYGPGEWEQVSAAIERWRGRDRLALVYADTTGRVYELRGR